VHGNQERVLDPRGESLQISVGRRVLSQSARLSAQAANEDCEILKRLNGLGVSALHARESKAANAHALLETRAGVSNGGKQSESCISRRRAVCKSASLVAVALLGVLGCQGGNEATSVEQDTKTVVVTTTFGPTTGTPNAPTPEAQLLGSITSCDVREIVFGHGGITYIQFRGGERYAEVRLGGEPAEERIGAAAYKQRCPNGKWILVGIE
jgi:hypothetical protein